eukprot:TRINITY_DN55741_c0_g1_i1.p1 TRINITY_DN55741_c0_g1~~TRINITY_DN55741_c0_g1_i1.p1  ORF type:complete len:964 (+),score=182.93 TRINITY_DN55741_c0_g1_i1:189-3080(+)
MAHRRSGAKRRALQKERAAEALVRVQPVAEVPVAQPPAASVGGRSAKPQALKPTTQEVVAAVASLYFDALKPFGRLLRKRIAERSVAGTSEAGISGAASATSANVALPDVDVQHLRTLCDECEQLRVEPEEGGDWSALLVGCPSNFVDVYSSTDVYPEELWEGARAYFESADDEEMTLPGGRYSGAQALMARNLEFLKGYTLGQVCHIVQLAISQKKFLGYLNGAVVQYSRSQSMMKENCAQQQQPSANPCQEAASLPVATWESAKSCLRIIIEEAVAAAACGEGNVTALAVPLSNIKRLFRSRFQIELSETTLGHSKLSELLQDSRFDDICTVRLEGQGYTVVPVAGIFGQSVATAAPVDVPAEDGNEVLTDPYGKNEASRAQLFCADEPLCLEDALGGVDEAMCAETIFGPTPGLFGPTPGPFGPTPRPSPLLPQASSSLVTRGDVALSLETAPAVAPNYLSQMLPLYLGALNCTNITGQPAEQHLTEIAAEMPLHFEGTDETPGASDLGLSPAVAHSTFCLDEPLSLEDASEPEVGFTAVFGQTPGPFAPSPLCADSSDWAVEPPLFAATPGPFAPSPVGCRPTHLYGLPSEVGLGITQPERCNSKGVPSVPPPTPPPSAPAPAPSAADDGDETAPKWWPGLSPWKDGKLSGMVQNTFIHAAVPPPTPTQGTLRRASSTGDLSESTTARSATSSCRGESPNATPGRSPRSVAVAAKRGHGDTACPGGSESSRQNSKCGATPVKLVGDIGLLSPKLVKRASSPLLEDGKDDGERRSLFCASEPLAFEDAGLLDPCSSPPPGLEAPVEWPAMSPWRDGKLNGMVQNTFIHAAPLPPTPTPGTLRRSISMPQDFGCDACPRSLFGAEAGDQQDHHGDADTEHAGLHPPTPTVQWPGTWGSLSGVSAVPASPAFSGSPPAAFAMQQMNPVFMPVFDPVPLVFDPTPVSPLPPRVLSLADHLFAS